MRSATLNAARVLVLAGPTAIAFFSGGFFEMPRLTAAIVAWALVVVAAVAAARPLPRSGPPRLALAGLAALTAWVGLSLLWAPLAGAASADFQRLLLYLGGLLAATALLRGSAARRWVEPAVAGGVVAIFAYSVSERVLPGVFELTRSSIAGGRLEQPLTYWNAMGALGAIGLVLLLRLAGSEARPVALRVAAAAASPLLGAGIYLTFSRASLLAVAVGLIVLLAVAPRWPQIRAVAVGLPGVAVAALVSSNLPAVTSFRGDLATREREGAIMLATIVVLGAIAAVLQLWCRRQEAAGAWGTRALRRPRGAAALAAGVAVVVVAGLVATSALERPGKRPARATASAERLGSLDTDRYAYWRVALSSFADQPLRGTGSGGFRVEWLRERGSLAAAQDAHSLYLESLAELGLVGFAALAALIGGVAAAARRVLARQRAMLAGAVAALAAWAVHAGLDWDWEVPGLSLFAVVLAGALLAAADEEPSAASFAPEPETVVAAPAAGRQPAAAGDRVARG